MCLIVIGDFSKKKVVIGEANLLSRLLSSFNLALVRVMGPVFPLKTGPISSNKIATKLLLSFQKKVYSSECKICLELGELFFYRRLQELCLAEANNRKFCPCRLYEEIVQRAQPA